MLKTTDLHWLAGILEGEGCFRLSTGGSKNGGGTPEITLSMTDADIVEKAKALMCPSKRIYVQSFASKKTAYSFRPNGSVAAGWMMTLYPPLSERPCCVGVAFR